MKCLKNEELHVSVIFMRSETVSRHLWIPVSSQHSIPSCHSRATTKNRTVAVAKNRISPFWAHSWGRHRCFHRWSICPPRKHCWRWCVQQKRPNCKDCWRMLNGRTVPRRWTCRRLHHRPRNDYASKHPHWIVRVMYKVAMLGRWWRNGVRRKVHGCTMPKTSPAGLWMMCAISCPQLTFAPNMHRWVGLFWFIFFPTTVKIFKLCRNRVKFQIHHDVSMKKIVYN